MLADPRVATLEDLPAIRALIPISVRGLNAGLYSEAQLAASLAHLFGADTQIIEDGTYFVVPAGDGTLAACGGWSRRKTLYGGDQFKAAADPLLNPAVDPARVRAMFVHPAFARRGLGRTLLDLCRAAARAEGFRALALGSTLPGVPLYTAYGFRPRAEVAEPMPGGLTFPLVRMEMEIG